MSSRPDIGPGVSARISVGRVLGDRFEITGVLGEGGTGIVYDAVRLDQNDRIALKVIHSHLFSDKQIRGRFTREAAILRRLEGPHLSAILDFGEIPDPNRSGNGLLYIALPKIEGPALDRLLRDDGPLPIDRALDIALQICEALKSAHSQGVIHRDLKPANVILRDGKHAIVVDFGMAKIVTGGGTGTTALTAHNMVFGTPEYMAPEQARGDELDARCDVYATGVMLYELLTGSVPFRGGTPLSVLTAHLTTPPVAPRTRAPERGISPALEAVVLHAVVKDPAQRYATASALATAILHARVAPSDVDGVRPGVYLMDTDADAHGPTMPSPIPTRPPTGYTSSRPPSDTPIDSRAGPVFSTRPPMESKPSTRPPLPDKGRLGTKAWTLAWIVAAVLSISIGIWLSLKLN